MGDEVKGSIGRTRTYDSPVRRARARETEGRVLAAASAAFTELGYVGTSIAAIAERAEVDPRTVYKIFGSKVGVLSRLVDVTMVGDQEAVPVMDRPWAITALEAPTAAERTSAFAAAIRRVMERAGAVFRTAAQAAVAEPEAAALWALGQRKREEDATAFVAALDGASMLRGDRPRASAAATVWLLTSPETFLQLTDGLGWSLEEYEQWLERSLVDALLDRPTSGRVRDTPR
jgi:AcrR family transcriptional regulator